MSVRKQEALKKIIKKEEKNNLETHEQIQLSVSRVKTETHSWNDKETLLLFYHLLKSPFSMEGPMCIYIETVGKHFNCGTQSFSEEIQFEQSQTDHITITLSPDKCAPTPPSPMLTKL